MWGATVGSSQIAPVPVMVVGIRTQWFCNLYPLCHGLFIFSPRAMAKERNCFTLHHGVISGTLVRWSNKSPLVFPLSYMRETLILPVERRMACGLLHDGPRCMVGRKISVFLIFWCGHFVSKLAFWACVTAYACGHVLQTGEKIKLWHFMAGIFGTSHCPHQPCKHLLKEWTLLSHYKYLAWSHVCGTVASLKHGQLRNILWLSCVLCLNFTGTWQ